MPLRESKPLSTDMETHLPPPAMGPDTRQRIHFKPTPDGSQVITYWDLPRLERVKMALTTGFFVFVLSACITFFSRWIAMAFSESVPEGVWLVFFFACFLPIYRSTATTAKQVIIKRDGIVFGPKRQHQLAFKDVTTWTLKGREITASVPKAAPHPQEVSVAQGVSPVMSVLHAEIHAAWSTFHAQNGSVPAPA
ncbi:hypothetical protein LMG26846_03364 [Achromobacter insuavis]|uniref:hypothetical protein n=1 Tax=Achromobacter insuavis TaxID=1287735 RepID=UPI0014650B2F|nr:hypothetical protein [Achromobacter insuavis]CAB3878350.1 hypothetical protein LMG26846_03364 [Achromobacter insuavis]